VKISENSRRKSRRSRGLRRRFAAVVFLCVVAALSGWGLSRAHSSRAANTVPLHGTEPAALHAAEDAFDAVPRPLPPSPPWTASQIARLRQSVRDAFAPALSGAERWSMVVLGASGETLYDDRASHAVVPASTAKLVVAATALDLLGSSFRYHTILAAPHAIAPDGSLDGNLWLAGSGDPSLRGDDVRAGVGVLAHRGLRRIAGSAAVDPTAMHGPELNPHWDPADAGQDYAPPTNALSIDGDTVESQKSVNGVEEHYWTPVRDVPRYASDMLERMLAQRGIPTSKPPLVGASPLDSVVLWEHRSAPLRALEAHMLYYSDNHYAEQLLRTLGGEMGGVADDTGGLSAERRFLSERGIPNPGLRLNDGSGLSGDDRIAAVTLARILSDAQLRGGDASLYLLLPQGGEQGTLEDYDFTTALGRVRAKSGHITGVSSLAGYVNTLHHGRVVFAFMLNGSPGDPDAAIVRAVDRLAEL
jgi:serine-type D-Ala-D-Ala carboxypeptidase/endopeptidase (penicillin-binding protein 4)